MLHRAGSAAIAMKQDRKSTRLNSSHSQISYAVFCLKKKIGIQNERGWLSHEQKHYADAVAAFDDSLAINNHDEGALLGKIAAVRACRQFSFFNAPIATALTLLSLHVALPI